MLFASFDDGVLLRELADLTRQRRDSLIRSQEVISHGCECLFQLRLVVLRLLVSQSAPCTPGLPQRAPAPVDHHTPPQPGRVVHSAAPGLQHLSHTQPLVAPMERVDRAHLRAFQLLQQFSHGCPRSLHSRLAVPLPSVQAALSGMLGPLLEAASRPVVAQAHNSPPAALEAPAVRRPSAPRTEQCGVRHSQRRAPQQPRGAPLRRSVVPPRPERGPDLGAPQPQHALLRKPERALRHQRRRVRLFQLLRRRRGLRAPRRALRILRRSLLRVAAGPHLPHLLDQVLHLGLHRGRPSAPAAAPAARVVLPQVRGDVGDGAVGQPVEVGAVGGGAGLAGLALPPPAPERALEPPATRRPERSAALQKPVG